MKKILEICADCLQSAIIAEKCGANRIELCSDLPGGGLTPSIGTLTSVVSQLKIPVYVLIRPREGNFCYNDAEIKSMLYDIDVCKKAGAAGIVTGALLPDGSIDLKNCKKLAEKAKPLDLTFNRAFDLTNAPYEAVDQIHELGFSRILTSGHKISALAGLRLIVQLVRYAGDRIIIMPGAGINEDNIQRIITVSGAKEFHMSLRSPVNDIHTLEALTKNGVFMSIDAERVRKIRTMLDTKK
jgi:copper homeostasis protein